MVGIMWFIKYTLRQLRGDRFEHAHKSKFIIIERLIFEVFIFVVAKKDERES